MRSADCHPKRKHAAKGLCHSCYNGKPKYRARDKVWRAIRRAWVDGLKNSACIDCKVKYPPYVMQFDHVRGKKSGEPGIIAMNFSVERVLEEIAKCDLVCSNCHAERTHKRNTDAKAVANVAAPSGATNGDGIVPD